MTFTTYVVFSLAFISYAAILKSVWELVLKADESLLKAVSNGFGGHRLGRFIAVLSRQFTASPNRRSLCFNVHTPRDRRSLHGNGPPPLEPVSPRVRRISQNGVLSNFVIWHPSRRQFTETRLCRHFWIVSGLLVIQTQSGRLGAFGCARKLPESEVQ